VAVDAQLSRPAWASQHRGPDWFASRVYAGALYGACGVFIAIIGGLVIEMVWGSGPSLREFGVSFLWGTEWNPVANRFGAAPFIYGTFVSSVIALLLAGAVGIFAGVFLAEFCPPRLSAVLSALIELLAAVPSIVYGLWGLFVLAPFVSSWIGPALQTTLGFLPIFQGTIYGVNMLTAALILALMIVPTITAITRDLVVMIPSGFREAALSLGATRWETVRNVVLPFARRGIFGACMLAFGRALGETIATTMVIGNRPAISASLFAPGYTVASVIANEFTEATSDLYLSALIELGLILLIVSIIVIALGRLMVRFLLD
jgi:phosphate transport system permease protein